MVGGLLDVCPGRHGIAGSDDGNDRRKYRGVYIRRHDCADIRWPSSAPLARYKGDNRNGRVDRPIGEDHIAFLSDVELRIFAGIGDIGAQGAIRNIERDTDRPSLPSCLLPFAWAGWLRKHVRHGSCLRDGARW